MINAKNKIYYGKCGRKIALLMALLMIFSAFSIFRPFAVSADEIFEKTLLEDFEDDELNYQAGSGTNASDYVSVVDCGDADLIYGKALKFDLSTAPVGSYQYDIKANSVAGSYVPSVHTNYANYYAETSFDITPNVVDRPLYVYLRNGDGNKDIITLHWSTDGKFYTKNNGIDEPALNKIGTYQNGRMMNVKVVQQWTDSEKNSVYAVTGIYVNGTLVDTTNVSFPNPFDTAEPGKCDTIRLFCKQNEANKANGAVIDNISCVRYTSADGTSPVADFSALRAEITACSGLLSSDEYAEADLEEFKNDIKAAVSVHNNIKATQTQVNDALAALVNARKDLRFINKTPGIYEDFEDDTYTNISGTLDSQGTIDSTAFAGKFYNKVLKYSHDAKGEMFQYINTQKLNANADENYVVTSVDFMPYGTEEAKTYGYLWFGNEGSYAKYFIRFTITDKGELLLLTYFNNEAKMYCGGSTESYKTDNVTLAEGIDLGRMHNLKLVLYRDPAHRYDAATGTTTAEIVGIYLDGVKLDYLNNSEQTIYPISSPVVRTNYLRVTNSSALNDADYGTYGMYVDNIASIQTTGGQRAVEKELLKSAITESYYVFESLSAEKQEAVTAKLQEAEALYANPAAGQIECDTMAAELEQLLLPSLETYIEKINIPSTVSANVIVLPEFDGVTTSVSSSPEIIANDGTVTQPTDKAVEVVLTVTLTRGDETASKEFNVTVLPRLAVEINSVKFTDVNGNTVYGQTNGGTLSKITVKKHTDEAAKIIAAVYAKDVLMNTKVIDAADGEAEVNLALGENGAETEIRFFVWSDLNMLNPLQKAIVQPETTTIYILGDSIYAEQPADSIPEGQAGIGKMLKNNYNQADVVINNMSYCGQSSKSFADNYRLNSALNKMSVGDYAIVSFAHNDEKADLPANYSPLDDKTAAPFTAGTYQGYIERYVNEIREQGAIPILITSLPRFKFGEDGKLSETHGGYIQAMKDVAAATDCIIIDLNGYAKKEINDLGEAGAKKYYNGDDTTHLSEEGAQWLADYISDQMEALGLSISKYRE